jgi:hypothetical protein
MEVEAEWKARTIVGRTKSLVLHGEVQECQRCGPNVARNATNGILNAGIDTSVCRVEDVTCNPQIGTSGRLRRI